jgi:hypothetical protein
MDEMLFAALLILCTHPTGVEPPMTFSCRLLKKLSRYRHAGTKGQNVKQ